MHDSVSFNKSLRRIPQSIMSTALFIKLRGPFVDYRFRCWNIGPLRCSFPSLFRGNLETSWSLASWLSESYQLVAKSMGVEVYNQISSASTAANSIDELEIAIRSKFTLVLSSSRSSIMFALYSSDITQT